LKIPSQSVAEDLFSGADPSAASRKRKPGQDAERFKTDKSGKLVITDDEAEQGVNSNGNDVAGSAFINATRGIDGARRDARGNLRFNKNTKRSRAQEQALGMNLDEVMGEKPKDRDGRKKKKSKVVGRLGEEFRARVS